MSKLTALIIDNEPLARDAVRFLLKRRMLFDEIAEAGNALEALAYIKSHPFPDLIFLDIHMPQMSGMQFLQQLHEIRSTPNVIFITAYDEYALKAFELNATDYLLKPYDTDRFNAAVDRAVRQITQTEQDSLHRRMEQLIETYENLSKPLQAKEYLKRFLVKEAKRIFFVSVERVELIEACGDYVKIYEGKKQHLINESLNHVEAQLDPEQFIRIHRSYVVNMNAIEELYPHFNGEYNILLKNSEMVKMSRSYRDAFRKSFDNML